MEAWYVNILTFSFQGTETSCNTMDMRRHRKYISFEYNNVTYITVTLMVWNHKLEIILTLFLQPFLTHSTLVSLGPLHNRQLEVRSGLHNKYDFHYNRVANVPPSSSKHPQSCPPARRNQYIFFKIGSQMQIECKDDDEEKQTMC